MTNDLPRSEAITKLQMLIGRDLRELATQYNVTVFKENGGFNKGWAGHVLESYLGLPLNTAQTPDFGNWELKLVPLKMLASGKVVPKETMAITMINPVDVAQTPFDQSHLYIKLRRMVVCARMFVDKQETRSVLYQVQAFDFDDHEDREMIEQIKEDYEEVRTVLKEAKTVQEGFATLRGKMGLYVQPRTKGAGHGSVSRAFYLRTNGLKKLLKL